MPITASQLRADIYNVLDRAIETGEPVEIVRKGVVVRLVPPRAPNFFDRLVPRPDVVVGDSDDLVSIDGSVLWNPEFP